MCRRTQKQNGICQCVCFNSPLVSSSAEDGTSLSRATWMTFSFFPRLLLSLPTLSHSLRPLATAFSLRLLFLASCFHRVSPLCILRDELCVRVSCDEQYYFWETDLGCCVGGGRISEVWLLPIRRAFQRLDWHELVWRQLAFLQFGCVVPYNERMCGDAAPICEAVVSGCHADQMNDLSVINKRKSVATAVKTSLFLCFLFTLTSPLHWNAVVRSGLQSRLFGCSVACCLSFFPSFLWDRLAIVSCRSERRLLQEVVWKIQPRPTGGYLIPSVTWLGVFVSIGFRMQPCVMHHVSASIKQQVCFLFFLPNNIDHSNAGNLSLLTSWRLFDWEPETHRLSLPKTLSDGSFRGRRVLEYHSTLLNFDASLAQVCYILGSLHVSGFQAWPPAGSCMASLVVHSLVSLPHTLSASLPLVPLLKSDKSESSL